MRFRITIILMIALGGLTAIAVGTVLFVSASASIKNTLELTNMRARLTISAVERGVFEHVKPARNLIADLSRRVADGTLDINDRASLTETLSGALAPAPQLGGVVVWRPDGSGLWVTRGANGRINVENTPGTAEFEAFLKDIATVKQIRWGNPYYRDGQTFITITGNLSRDGVQLGAIGAGVSLVALSQFVGEVADRDVTPFILYGDTHVLAHPILADGENSRSLSADKPLLLISEINDPVLAPFPTLEHLAVPGLNDFDIRESDEASGDHLILSRISPGFGDVPWRIGVHVPADAISQQINRLAGSIAISLATLAVAVIAALGLARMVARPVRAVSAAAEKIERLELDTIEPLRHSIIREIDDQARSFNHMVQGLRWLQTYVPRKLVQRLIGATGAPAVEARQADLTVMFTDIVGFTARSEKMPPARVAEMLNDHFELVNGCIEAELGTLDKYIGDAAMAFWGAPEPIPDHAARACRAALAIAKATREGIGREPETTAHLKIAIHTGPLIVGNIGARTRMNYTVIGDTVNVCSRIEEIAGTLADHEPVTILVSSEVVNAAGSGFMFEPLGNRTVKGRQRTVSIWRLVGELRPLSTGEPEPIMAS
ncbi:MAG: adenylate/guanylate cyclase domain-containing protein [Rhizobiales bacterium]|nr:adenylate/guanylate cyclase domain-containing protein [Hyphomicrobiales bacterium]